MFSFFLIYLFIFIISFFSAFILKRKEELREKFALMLKLSLINYWTVCLFRTLVGNGHQYLATSFIDKTFNSYIKVFCLLISVLILFLVFCRIFKKNGERYSNLAVGIFSALLLLYSIVLDIPIMYEVVTIGIVSMLLAVGAMFLSWDKEAEYGKRNIMEIIFLILLFSVIFFITGPTELFVYNSDGFVFSFADFFFYMISYTLLLFMLGLTMIFLHLPQKILTFTELLIFIYCVCSYIQQMILNGEMERMEGVAQKWTMEQSVINIGIWIAVAILIIVIYKKIKNKNRFLLAVSSYIIAIQAITFVVILITNPGWNEKNRQLVEDDIFTMSANENIAIFVLDAFDTQMMEKVMKDDFDYLAPLHDFTYYKYSNSRYFATNGSMPYLLTGKIAEEEKNPQDIYKNSHFLRDIKENGYTMHFLTEEPFVRPFEEGLIKNQTDSYYCILDFEKTVGQMSKCVRYRTAPFVLKSSYYYENYDITNVIHDTNVYLLGTDADFYADMMKMGITIDYDYEHMMHLYHLYGAHSPYYLTENAELNYNSNPMAQWRGSLRIVYDYLEKLKEAGLYDQTAVIIMADHGLNRTQRLAMDEWNIDVTEDSNPIFFIKNRNQKQSEMVISDKTVSHDDFFGTIMELIGVHDSEFKKTIWN